MMVFDIVTYVGGIVLSVQSNSQYGSLLTQSDDKTDVKSERDIFLSILCGKVNFFVFLFYDF